MAPQADPIQTDALIVGAGPAGLFQVFELGLLEISAHVVDSLPQAGGQPVELYPDKPIFDIPGVPVCTGRELTDSLLKQIAPFAPGFHFNQEVSRIERQADGRFAVQTSHGTRFITRTIFVAAGVGAFRPRTLKVEGLDTFEGTQVFYSVRNPADLAGRQLLIVGASDTALEWAIDLATGAGQLAAGAKAGKVTLLHRRDVFDAAPATVEKMKALCASGAMEFITGQVTAPVVHAGKLTHATVTVPDGSSRDVPLDLLLVFSGLSPKLGPVADWGLQLERKQLTVDTEKFSTSEPGIFAVGDINTYPGKKKLIVSAFHECALAAFGAAALVFPDRPVQLQYTTTSPRLHTLLGATIPTVP